MNWFFIILIKFNKYIINGKFKRTYNEPIIYFVLKVEGRINNHKIKKFDTFIINDEVINIKGNLEIIEISIEMR